MMWKFVVRKDNAIDNPSGSANIQELQENISTTAISSPTSSPLEQANQHAINERERSIANCSKPKRKFNALWQKAFPWVKLVNKKMFCDVCMNNRRADKSSAFVNGCENFHIKSLRTHNTSSGYMISGLLTRY